MTTALPLDGVLVLDLTRMIPGAVLVRNLVDLGARVIKVEEPGHGDPLRAVPPLVDGVGTGFHAFFRGVESIVLDLASPAGAKALAALARHADVLLESFRPGTLARWGLDPAALRARNASLVTVSLPGFASQGEDAQSPVHDLNVVALTGLLAALPGHGSEVPKVQIADVAAGLLATSSLLAALLLRARTGSGLHVEQPLVTGPLPFLTWTFAEASLAAGSGSSILAGEVPAYHLYACADGKRVALGALEPKFFSALVDAMDVGPLAAHGLSRGAEGAEAASFLAARFATRPAAEWAALGASIGVPLTVVTDAASALDDRRLVDAASVESAPSGGAMRTHGPLLLRTAARKPLAPAPALGSSTTKVMTEFGL